MFNFFFLSSWNSKFNLTVNTLFRKHRPRIENRLYTCARIHNVYYILQIRERCKHTIKKKKKHATRNFDPSGGRRHRSLENAMYVNNSVVALTFYYFLSVRDNDLQWRGRRTTTGSRLKKIVLRSLDTC